ncbi:MAG: A/G-specific adenine glycosylase [Alphaproteobacteria bacterium]|nr:A/G-specific adenine glycosylase [Alphaproteobacteria bacterium]
MKNENLTELLLQWYRLNGRDLPWRHKGGAHPNPYIVLVSEMMLQQTTVATVLNYFPRFIARFPNIQSLAAASEDEVYRCWQGLGYYSRARSLHASAQQIAFASAGCFPQTPPEVLKLKGVGKYTAASFLALAYNQPQTVVDGNVIRIMCRMYRLLEPLEQLQSIIMQKAEALTSKENAADYASAIMDLGATVCTPKKPRCDVCPWQKYCLSALSDDVEQIPAKTRQSKRKIKGKVYVLYNAQGQVFVRKRTEKGLLSGLYEFPWCESGALFAAATDSRLKVHHIFTHIDMTLEIYVLKTEQAPADGYFAALNNLPALSTLMKKVLSQIKDEMK